MYTESDPRTSNRELLQLLNNFSKVAGYKINSSISVAFIYSKDKQTEKEIREMTLFTIATKFHMFGKSHPKILYTVCGYCEGCHFLNFFLGLLILYV